LSDAWGRFAWPMGSFVYASMLLVGGAAVAGHRAEVGEG
jgi:hypothetical protein